MATVIFYEKPGCINNTKQKALLQAAGHEVRAHNLLTQDWTAEELRQFFGDRPVPAWFNRSAPTVKSGIVVPETLDGETALAMMLQDPLLIRRPLIQVGNRRVVGFDSAEMDTWIGLQSIDETAQTTIDTLKQQDLQTCPNTHKQQSPSQQTSTDTSKQQDLQIDPNSSCLSVSQTPSCGMQAIPNSLPREAETRSGSEPLSYEGRGRSEVSQESIPNSDFPYPGSHKQQWEFNVEGQFLGFVREGSKLKYLYLEVSGEHWQIKLSKISRASLKHTLSVGDRIQVSGVGKLSSSANTFKLKAYQIQLLSSAAALSIAKPEPTPKPRFKILLCQKSGCLKRGGKGLREALEKALSDRNLQSQIKIEPTGCLKRCSGAPNLVLMPGKTHYSGISLSKIESLLENISKILHTHSSKSAILNITK